MDLPSTMPQAEAAARAANAQREAMEREALRAAEERRRRQLRRERWDAWVRWAKRWERAAVMRVAPGWAQAGESGRTRLEQALVEAYYRVRGRARTLLAMVVLTVVSVVAWPWLAAAWRGWLLSQPPETTAFFDDRNVYVEGVRVPAVIDVTTTTGAAEAEWARAAPLLRLSAPADLSATHRYVWRDGREYAFAYSTWERLAEENGPRRCLCGPHVGLPFHVVAYGQRRWAEPRVLAWTAAGRDLPLADALAPAGETTPIATAARVLSIAHGGLSRQEVGAAEATCLLRCARWAEAHGGLPPLE